MKRKEPSMQLLTQRLIQNRATTREKKMTKVTRLLELIKECQVLQAEAMNQVVKHRKKQERAFRRLLKELE